MDPTAFVTPCLLAGAALYALRQRVDVFSALTQGAGEGLSVVMRNPAGFGSPADGGVYAAGLRSHGRSGGSAVAGAGCVGHPTGDGGPAAGAAGQRVRSPGRGQPADGDSTARIPPWAARRR